MENMSSKERVLAAFHHKVPDRVPIDYDSNPDIDRRLKQHYGLDSADSEGLARQLGVDFRRVEALYVGPRLHKEPEEADVQISPDWGLRTRYMKHATGGYWEPWPGRIQEMDEETAAAYPMPSPDDYDYAAITEACERHKGYAVSTHSGFEVMNWTGRHVGDEAMYVGLATGDPGLMLFINRYIDIKFEVLKRTIAAARGGLTFIRIGEDLGTQRGPRISLDMFRERIRPIHERFINLAREHGLPVMIHSCGSCSWAFNDFIDMGIAVVDALQPEPVDMDPSYLKRVYGDKLAFHGCISTAGPVATGTPEDTVEYCKRTLEIMMPNGGYCFSPTHQLQDDSPTQNVVAMYETARKYGVY